MKWQASQLLLGRSQSIGAEVLVGGQLLCGRCVSPAERPFVSIWQPMELETLRTHSSSSPDITDVLLPISPVASLLSDWGRVT